MGSALDDNNSTKLEGCLLMLHTRTLRALALLAATLSAGNACTTAQMVKIPDAAQMDPKQQTTKTLADVGPMPLL